MCCFKDTFNDIHYESIQILLIIKINFSKFFARWITFFIVASFIMIKYRLKEINFIGVGLWYIIWVKISLLADNSKNIDIVNQHLESGIFLLFLNPCYNLPSHTRRKFTLVYLIMPREVKQVKKSNRRIIIHPRLKWIDKMMWQWLSIAIK